MIPLIRILCAVGVIAGASGFVWYDSLLENDKQSADHVARQLAVKLYRQAVEDVTPEQATRIEIIVRECFRAWFACELRVHAVSLKSQQTAFHKTHYSTNLQ